MAIGVGNLSVMSDPPDIAVLNFTVILYSLNYLDETRLIRVSAHDRYTLSTVYDKDRQHGKIFLLSTITPLTGDSWCI